MSAFLQDTGHPALEPQVSHEGQVEDDDDLLFGRHETQAGPDLPAADKNDNPNNNLSQSKTASAIGSGADVVQNDQLLMAEFLKWKQMQAQQSQQLQQAKPQLQDKSSSNRIGGTFVMNEREQAKYKEFSKEKKACYRQFDATVHAAPGLNANAVNDGTTDAGAAGAAGGGEVHPFRAQFEDMCVILNNIYAQASKNYGKILQIFEETDEKCSNKWRIDSMDEKESKPFGTPNSPDGVENKDFDTIDVMQYNIDFFRLYTNKVEQFGRNLALNLNTFKESLKQFENEMVMEEGVISGYSYDDHVKEALNGNFAKLEPNNHFDYILPPGTPRSMRGAPSSSREFSQFSQASDGASPATPPPQGQGFSRARSSHGSGPQTMEPPSFNTFNYSSDGLDVSHPSDFEQDLGPLSPGSRMSTMRDMKDMKKTRKEEKKDDEENAPKQLGFICSSHLSNVFFKDNNIDGGLIVCNYKIKNSDHAGTTVMFTPSVNGMFRGVGSASDEDMIEASVSAGSTGVVSSSGASYDSITRVTGPVRVHEMRVTLTQCMCNNQVLTKGGYNFQVGVIVVPKDVKMVALQNKFEQIKLKNTNCYLHNLSQKEALFETFDTYYVNFTYFTSGNNMYRCCFGKNEYRDYVSLYYNNSEYKDEYCFKKGDEVTICIEEHKAKSHYLSFRKGGKLMGKNLKDKEFKHGRIKLNLSKNRYLFAISSIRCDCRKPLMRKKIKKYEGYEFECKIVGKRMSVMQ